MPSDPGLGPETILQHYAEEDLSFNAVTPPIYQSSLFTFEHCDDMARAMRDTPDGPPFHYSRIGNPNLRVVEEKLAKLEGTDKAKVFGSGMAAIYAALMSCVESGGHIVAVDTCYGPVRSMLTTYFPKIGVSSTFADGLTPESILDAIKPETQAVYLESPSSIVFRLQEIGAVTKVCKEKKIPVVIDNTYSTPLYQTPAAMGVDIVVHSGTKYIGGHSDLTAGVVCLDAKRFDSFIRNEVAFIGSALGPFQAWLVLRGLRTLAVRLRQHEATANSLAVWLERRPEVRRVHHPSLASYPQKQLFSKQMRGTSGLFSFEPKNQGEDWVKRFVDSLEIFKIGVSWGGFESLAVPIQLSGFAPGLEGWVIRLSCGLENPEDLIGDLDQAFAKAHE